MGASELLEQLRDAACQLFPGRGILAAYAHGSRVSGRPLPHSDLDVGYYPEGYLEGQRLTLHEELLLGADLTDALGVEVDFRDLTEAPLELRGKVLEEGMRIYSGNDIKRVALERDLLGRYHDYKPIFQEMHRIRLRQLAKRSR